MTGMTQAVRTTRSIIRAGGFYDAVRYLRGLGLSFTTAKTMATEIRDGAVWYRRY